MTDMENYMMSESETMVSAFVDGEADWVVGLFAPGHDEIRRFHDYHLIRATMRGMPMSASASETIIWHQQQFVKLWARVDAAQEGQMD